MNIKNTQEYRQNLLDEQTIYSILNNNNGASYINHDQNPVLLGKDFLLKVNTSVGISDIRCLDAELRKIERITALSFKPDLIMDHTPIHIEKKALWERLIEMTEFPIGVVPVYSVFDSTAGIDKSNFINEVERMSAGGISFMTFHPTATRELFEVANKTRTIPSTSWGGALVLKDSIINHRHTNLIDDTFEDILSIMKKYNVTISIGSAFRPARIDEALDIVHHAETELQKRYIDMAVAAGVNVIMEGLGHIELDAIEKYCELISDYNAPIMPLGPMPTDATIGFDHVSSAIGATELARKGNVAIINSVTRAEHSGGIPSESDVIEGLMSARTVAHIVNMTRFKSYRLIDKAVSDNRASIKTCVVNGGIFNLNPNPSNTQDCRRCNWQCPYKMLN